MNAFTTDPGVLSLVQKAEALKLSGKRFSDIQDEEGHQYVDLVQEGGGVLGIALVGYTYILEQAGIRFFSLAGTSAGAINALMLAGLGPIQEAKSEKILALLTEKNLFDLLDGDKGIKKLIQRAVKGEGGIGWALTWQALKIYRTLRSRLGINPGNEFQKWLSEELRKHGIERYEDMARLREQLPEGFINIKDGNIEGLKPKLAIVASDITTKSKAEFPKMASLYWQDPMAVHPSEFVRASMSIPFFFEPYEVLDLPNKGKHNDPQWLNYCKYQGPVPDKVRFVDGGLLSNFPINVFHRTDGKAPRLPTFGVRLSAFRQNFSKTDDIRSLTGSILDTMRQIYDYDFLLRNPDYKQLICRIDADQEFNWLDFEMPVAEQVKLFSLGAYKAMEFLEKFDWQQYKLTRTKPVEKRNGGLV
ncbi:MAG: patatin-like phospholipase family protein [Cyclobacteriaceae bacterium]|nr:patatin-like phospholipase family protein [Cyclobacteriaceae bacterium]